MSEARPVYRTLVYDSSRWEGFRFRDGDIVISTPPKCGTTWTQQICSLLIFQTAEQDRPLSVISPWLDMLTRKLGDVVADLEAQRHRRFIKTHTPLDGLPWDPRVTYIGVARDPRDVALSWDGHVLNADGMALFAARDQAVGNADIQDFLADPPPMPESPVDRFWAWVETDDEHTPIGSSLQQVMHHLRTFWERRSEPNVILLHYDDLKRDLEGQMRGLAARLGIEVPEEKWPGLVQAATFEQMRKNADRIVPGSTEQIWQSNQQFFRSGKSGQWREILDEEGVRRYQARVRSLADDALARWAHEGGVVR